jgi:hypothetical protein
MATAKEGAMASRLCWSWLCCAHVLIACEAETLAIGELRCAGEGVTCERPIPIEADVRHLPDDFTVVPTVDARAAWVAELPCPTDECMAVGARLLVHPDGSLTVARIIRGRVQNEDGSSQRGVWLARIASDGTVIWQDESLIETGRVDDTLNEPWFRVALTLGADGEALLAVLRGIGLFIDGRAGSGELSLYAVGDRSGEVTRLFGGDVWSDVTAVGEAGGELLVAGYHRTGRAFAPNPELARYRRDGTLVVRQTALRRTDAADLETSQVTLDAAVDVPLIVDGQGNASLAVLELDKLGPDEFAYSIVQVGSDGNVRWTSSPPNGPFSPPELKPARLALDRSGRVILGQSPYQVARFAPPGEPTRRIQWTGPLRRIRHEFWEPDLMGLDCDSLDRILVATQVGTFAEHRLVIDRIAEDFGRRETFMLPELSANGSQEFAQPSIEGLRAGPDNAVYLWVDSKIARVDLP